VARNVLVIEGLEAGYGDVQVLWGVSLEVPEGQITTMIGANGAGKTTTLRAVVGSIPVRHGRVLLEGEDVSRLSPHQKVRLGMTLVPEGRQIFANLSVSENLAMGGFSRPQHASRNLERIYALFPRLRERPRQIAGTLSGGEQQLLAIGRALMSEPRLLLIDEMSLGLAPVLVQQLFATLRRLNQDGTTILLVEQNIHFALAASRRAYVLAEGRVVRSGPSREIAASEDVRRAYLGM
jgi:branched-chain amino acid transport system ATP-binding protein